MTEMVEAAWMLLTAPFPLFLLLLVVGALVADWWGGK